jgi:hypothetical protein
VLPILEGRELLLPEEDVPLISEERELLTDVECLPRDVVLPISEGREPLPLDVEQPILEEEESLPPEGDVLPFIENAELLTEG